MKETRSQKTSPKTPPRASNRTSVSLTAKRRAKAAETIETRRDRIVGKVGRPGASILADTKWDTVMYTLRDLRSAAIAGATIATGVAVIVTLPWLAYFIFGANGNG